MTDQLPPPPPPPPGAPTSAPLPDPAEPAASKGRGGKVAAGAGAVVLAALVGGGAYAYNQLSGGGTQPQDVLPASSQAFVRIDLDPSASQKVELFKFLRKFPDAAEAVGIEGDGDDVRKLIFDEVSDACPDLDYDEDVEPWLGERLGVAASAKDESVVIAVQVTDEDKAKDGIAALFDCSGDDYGIGFSQGYALISPEQKMVDDALDEARDKPLAENKDFADDMDALGEPGVASAWVDLEGLGDSVGDIFPGADDQTVTELKRAGRVAMALRVDGNAAEIAGVSSSTEGFDTKPVPIGKLPDDTVIGLSFSGIGDQVSEQWEEFEDQIDELAQMFGGLSPTPSSPTPSLPTPSSPTPSLPTPSSPTPSSTAPVPAPTSGAPTFPGTGSSDPIDDFEEFTGLELPGDLEKLFGDTFTVAFGSTNLDEIDEISGPADLSRLNLAILSEGDSGALEVMEKLADLADELAGVKLVTEKTDEGAVLATSDDAAQGIVDGGSLGDSEAFKAAMPFGDDTVQAVYVDVAGIVKQLKAANPPRDVEDDLDEVKNLQSVGISAAKDGDRGRFSIRVVFAE